MTIGATDVTGKTATVRIGIFEITGTGRKIGTTGHATTIVATIGMAIDTISGVNMPDTNHGSTPDTAMTGVSMPRGIVQIITEVTAMTIAIGTEPITEAQPKTCCRSLVVRFAGFLRMAASSFATRVNTASPA